MAFSEFRKHFPNSPYLIVSDDGEDFSEYTDDKTYFTKSKTRLWGSGPNAYYYDNWEQWLDYYSKLKMACEICDTDYIMNMEDDVLINNSFTITNDFDVCGPCNGMLPDHTIKSIKKIISNNFNEKNLDKNYFYGLCGGAIFNARKFLDNYNLMIDNLKKYHYEYTRNLTEMIPLAADANFVVQFNLLNLNYTCSQWMDNEIIHPYKEYYNK